MPAVRKSDTSYQGCLWVRLLLHAPIDHLAGPIQSLTGYRYVGNKMAAFVMQTMGCDVAAINTVNFSMPLQATDPPSASSGLLAAFHHYLIHLRQSYRIQAVQRYQDICRRDISTLRWAQTKLPYRFRCNAHGLCPQR